MLQHLKHVSTSKKRTIDGACLHASIWSLEFHLLLLPQAHVTSVPLFHISFFA